MGLSNWGLGESCLIVLFVVELYGKLLLNNIIFVVDFRWYDNVVLVGVFVSVYVYMIYYLLIRLSFFVLEMFVI